MVEIGKKYIFETVVREEDTAKAFGSGELAVLATPRMIALMEEASYKCIADDIDDGSSTVGTFLEIKHLAATPVGMKVRVESEVTDVDGRKIVYSVRAYDEAGIIGEGKHERFIIFSEKFVAKTYSKLNK